MVGCMYYQYNVIFIMEGMNKNEKIAVAVGLVLVAVVLLFGIRQVTVDVPSPAGDLSTVNTTQNEGLQITDTVVGDGAEATPGKLVTVHYTGTLTDGTVFDSSVSRGTPFQFVLGAGQVIRGWEIGVEGMKVGGTRELVIPAALAYGDRAIGAIPANSTLNFEVELLDVSDLQ